MLYRIAAVAELVANASLPEGLQHRSEAGELALQVDAAAIDILQTDAAGDEDVAVKSAELISSHRRYREVPR